MAVPLPEATLPGILSYAEENNIDPQRTAKAVRAWQGQMRGYAQGTIATGDPDNAITPDNDRAWKGLLEVDRQASETLEGLRQKAIARTARQLVPDKNYLDPLLEAAATATTDPVQRMDYLRTGIMARKTAELFPDEAERESFTRKLAEAKGDPEAMDAPERWIQNARQIDATAQQLDAAANDTAFTPTRYQSGSIGIGPNVLGSYLVREKEDGTGYQAYVQPTTEGAKPITVDLPTLEEMRAKATERLTKAAGDYEQHSRYNDTSGGGFMGEPNVDFYGPRLATRAAAAKERADLINGPDLATALHVGLDDNLTENPAFLDQLPGGFAAWSEQFTLRPLNQIARGFAQAAAALPGTDNSALTAEGQNAVEITTPGALRNRYENSPEGTAPVADLIASGIESAGTMILPGALAKLGGRALAATSGTARGMMAAQVMDGAQVPMNTGWAAAFTTASGQSYAQTEQEAAAVEATDPAKAARLRRWNGLTSLARGAIEMGTEKIFPGEMALLAGGRVPLRSLATMPFQEAVEEGVGAVGQNAISAFTGQTMEDPLQAARGGFYGAAPFVAGAALAGRFTPQPADPNAPAADGPDNTLFPPANANPPDLGGPAVSPSVLAGIAQRGGREDPSTINPQTSTPSTPPIPTSGRTTAYGYADDETPDRNSSDGIGAFVSTAEAARIRRGEPSEMRLRPGDLAVSRDIEAQFRSRGIRPGDPVTLQYADGTTHTGRWMDRTDGSLDGRFDLYSPSGPPSNDGSKIIGFLPGGDPTGLPDAGPNVDEPLVPGTPEDLEDGTPNLLPDGVTPTEVITFQRAQDEHRARNPETATQPEPLRTLAAQLDLVREGTKPSMIFEGVTRDQIPAALRPLSMRDSPIDGVQTPGGYVVFNKSAIRPLVGLREADPYTSVQAAARAAFRDPAKSGLLLGYGTPDKSATANSALVTRDPDGTEVLAVATDDTDVSTTAAIEAAINRANAPRRALSASAANFRRSPLAEFVIQSGGIMSRSTAKQSGMFRNSPALWSDAPDRLADPTHNVIYGNTRPDELAEAAVRAGLLPEGSTQRELWEALGNESTAARSQARAERQVESDLRNQERAARREPLDVTLARRAAARREESQQAQRQTAEPVSMADPLPDPTDDPDYVPFARQSLNPQSSTLNPPPRPPRGVSPKAAQEALALIRQTLPAVADATRLVTNRDALADEINDYRPQDWADMGPGGVQGFYDPRTGQTTVILDNIEVRPGETPMRAVARIILHERIAHAGLAVLREADPTFARQWQQLTAQIPQGELQAIAAQYPELSGNPAALAEEWLAQQVEARAGKLLPPKSLAAKLWNALKAALARLFARYSRPQPLDAEVDRIIMLARNALKTQFGPTETDGSLNFARPNRIQAPFLPKPDRESNIFYAGEGAYRVQRPQLRALLTGRILPKEITEMVEASNAAKASFDQEAANIARDLQLTIKNHAKAHGLTEADVFTLVDDAMQNPATLAAIQDPALKEATRKARNLLDDASDGIATITGGQLGSAIMGNRGHWMRRAYKAFDPAASWTYDRLKDYAAKGKTVEGVSAAKLLNDAEAFLLNEDPARTPAQIEGILRDLMNRTVWEQALTSQAISKPVDSLMRRKDLAPELRAVMGEETNILKKFTNSAGFQAGFITKHEMQNRIADLGLRTGLFSTEKGGVYTKELSDGSPTAAGQRRSGFAGLYTTPEFKAALGYARIVEPQNLEGWFVKALVNMGGIAKANAVALSPKSWATNIFGGLVGVMQNGHLYDHRIVSRWQEAYRLRGSGDSKNMVAALGTAKQALIEQKRGMMARLTAAGINDSSFSLRDMDGAITMALDSYLKDPAKKWEDRLWGVARGAALGSSLGKFSAPTRVAGTIIGGIGGGIVGQERIAEATRRIGRVVLGKSDNFFKVLSFLSNYESHLLAGMPESAAFDLAAEKTNNTMPNYNKVWGPLKSASRLGFNIGSFVSFMSELYRNSYHAVIYGAKEALSSNPHTRMQGVRRLAGVASVQVLATYGIPALVAKIYDKLVGDDEDEIARKWWLPKWNRYQSLAYTQFDGKRVTYANTSYLIPQASLNEIIIAATEGRTLGEGLANALAAGRAQFGTMGIHTDPILQAIANRNGYDQVISKAKPGWEQDLERFLYASDKIFSPGLATDLEKVVRYATGADKDGRLYTPREVLESYLGFRTTTYDTPTLVKNALFKIKARYTDAVDRAEGKFKLNRPFGDRAAALTELNQTIAEIQADYTTFQQDMQKIGMGALARTVNQDRKDKNGKNTADIIGPNTFRPFRLGPKGIEPLPSK